MFNDNKYAFSSIPNAGILETLATWEDEWSGCISYIDTTMVHVLLPSYMVIRSMGVS